MKISLTSAVMFFRGAACVLSMLALGGPARAIERDALYNMSQEVLQAYRTIDADRFRRHLAAPLQTKYAGELLRQVLLTCRSLTGQVERLSLPVMGTRHYAFFAVYTEEAGVFDMLLEIDEDKKIIHFVISREVTSPDQICALVKER